MKKPKLKRDWIGRKVRTLREFTNGLMVIPAGAVLDVDGNRSGLHLRSAPCSCCGVRVIINGVAEWDVELLPEETPAQSL